MMSSGTSPLSRWTCSATGRIFSSAKRRKVSCTSSKSASRWRGPVVVGQRGQERRVAVGRAGRRGPRRARRRSTPHSRLAAEQLGREVVRRRRRRTRRSARPRRRPWRRSRAWRGPSRRRRRRGRGRRPAPARRRSTIRGERRGGAGRRRRRRGRRRPWRRPDRGSPRRRSSEVMPGGYRRVVTSAHIRAELPIHQRHRSLLGFWQGGSQTRVRDDADGEVSHTRSGLVGRDVPQLPARVLRGLPGLQLRPFQGAVLHPLRPRRRRRSVERWHRRPGVDSALRLTRQPDRTGSASARAASARRSPTAQSRPATRCASVSSRHHDSSSVGRHRPAEHVALGAVAAELGQQLQRLRRPRRLRPPRRGRGCG